MKESTTDTVPAVYCGTYSKYNNGSIAGAWLKLEDYKDATEFFEACRELHKDEEDPEYMFQDFEGYPRELYSESMSIQDAERLYTYIDLDEQDREILEEYMDATGYSFEDSIDHYEECYITELDARSTEEQQREYGEYCVDNGYFGHEIPEALQYYIDYEAIGREYLMDCSISSNGYVFGSY